MNITKLELINFRNYDSLKLDNFSNLNVIIGKNGIGKTSILEAIYVCSLTKSFKTNNEYSVIKENKDYFRTKLSLYENRKNKKIEVYFDNNGKKVKINDKKINKLSDFISQYKVILLSPDELKIIKASPNTRRNYINIQISQLHKEYIQYLNNYNVLIKNKNDYLRKLYLNSNLDERYLDIVDEKIIDLGIKINNYRNDYINSINNYISSIFNNFEKNCNIKVNYISDFNNKSIESIRKEVKKNRKKEIIIGMTSYGIHRDDMEFLHNGNNSKEYSSQGLQKLIVLSMKISEVKIFNIQYDLKPILLLDDLFSELDNANRNKIFEALNKEMQIFITTTDVKNISNKIIKCAKIFNLDERK